MSDQEKINEDWENWQDSKHGRSQRQAVDHAWDGYTTSKKKLKNISEDEAQKIVKEKSKIIKEGTEELKLSEIIPLIKSNYQKAGRKTNVGNDRGKQFARVMINYSVRLITAHDCLVEKKNHRTIVPCLKRGTLPPGLELAILDMKLNEVRSVIVPPELAFGNREIPGIPPYSTVEFEIELTKYVLQQSF